MRSAEARDEALAALYEADQRRSDPDTAGLARRAAEMAVGVWEERVSLDATLAATSSGWRVERMPPVDRNVLRLALWELRHRPGTPVAVVLSEAVRLAKRFSTARSGGFVNGVLARLVEERTEGSR